MIAKDARHITTRPEIVAGFKTTNGIKKCQKKKFFLIGKKQKQISRSRLANSCYKEKNTFVDINRLKGLVQYSFFPLQQCGVAFFGRQKRSCNNRLCIASQQCKCTGKQALGCLRGRRLQTKKKIKFFVEKTGKQKVDSVVEQ